MTCEIRRLRPDKVDAALDLAMETYLAFEAPDYGPRACPPSAVTSMTMPPDAQQQPLRTALLPPCRLSTC